MDARVYFRLTDDIAAARTPDELDAMREIVAATDMHPVERRAIERVIQGRAAALRGATGGPLSPAIDVSDSVH